MKVVICSENPVKVQAAKEAFGSFFEDLEFYTLSLNNHTTVLRQPMTREQTLESDVNRVEIAKNKQNADFYVSMEGGMGRDKYSSFLTWYVCVSNSKGEKSIAGGGRMPLPNSVYEELLDNHDLELGDIMDRISNEVNVKQKGGSTAIFTGDRIMRKDVFRREIIIALVPYTSQIYKEIEKSS